MFEMEVKSRAQKVPAQVVVEVQYLIKGDDMSIPFSSREGYTDSSAIARAQTMNDSPGLILYKKVGTEPATILYQPVKSKVFNKK